MSRAAGSRKPASSRAGTPVIVAVSAAVGIVALFLPMVAASINGAEDSSNFFQEAAGRGTLQLVLFALVIAVSILAGVVRQRWVRSLAGTLGILAGLLAAYVSFGTLLTITVGGALSSEVQTYVSIGFGTILLAIVSFVLTIFSIATLITRRSA